MSNKQPFNQKLLKKGAIVHFRCGGQDEVDDFDKEQFALTLKSRYSNYWTKYGYFYQPDVQHPLDIVSITPAKERERLRGFVGITVKENGLYTHGHIYKYTGVTQLATILDLSDCYHSDGTPWRVGDGK